jgi:competence protein ComFC
MGILDLVFPKTCLGCGREGRYICSDCLAKVRLSKPICPYCEKASIDGFTHIKCAKKLGLDGLTSVWEYEGVVRKAVLSLKYKYSTEVGKELISQLVNWLIGNKQAVPGANCLVPVPLFWYRQNVRGFNQSIEVGKTVAAQIGWKFVPDLLIKRKSTISQVELKGDDRRQNLKGVFSLNPSYQLTNQLINQSSYVIFDDVFTTGSTLREAAKVLKRAGVEKVWGLTIAR